MSSFLLGEAAFRPTGRPPSGFQQPLQPAATRLTVPHTRVQNQRQWTPLVELLLPAFDNYVMIRTDAFD